MYDQIFVLLNHRNDEFQESSLETLAFGQSLSRELGKPASAVVLGAGIDSLASSLAAYSLSSVLSVDDPRLAKYSYEFFTVALSRLVKQHAPSLLLMDHSYQNIDLAPRLAARLGVDLLTDCTGFRRKGDEILFLKQMFRGKLEAQLAFTSPAPWVVTVQAGSCRVEQLESGNAEIVRFPVDLEGTSVARRTLEQVDMAKGTVDLGKAEIIVGVGRGLKSKENLALVQELARLLKAEIGASRPVVDNEWLPRDRQIGSSGQNVSPKLYLALGISGAIQHIVGIKNASCIVAVNTDQNAPIFNIANYGIVGDLTDIVPRLIQELSG